VSINEIHNAVSHTLKVISPTKGITIHGLDGAEKRCSLEAISSHHFVITILHVLIAEAKVNHFYHILSVDAEIVGLDVLMEVASLVNLLNGINNLL
jgi:hypothetical protein